MIVGSLLLAALGPATFRGTERQAGSAPPSAGAGELEAELRRRSEARPDDPEAAVGLANLLDLDKHGSEVVDLYERAIALDPDNARYRRDFGATLSELGRDADAEVQFRRALAIEPGDAGARLGLASLLERAAPVRREEAIREYQRLARDEAGSYYAEEAVQALARLGAGSAASPPATPPAAAGGEGG